MSCDRTRRCGWGLSAERPGCVMAGPCSAQSNALRNANLLSTKILADDQCFIITRWKHASPPCMTPKPVYEGCVYSNAPHMLRGGSYSLAATGLTALDDGGAADALHNRYGVVTQQAMSTGWQYMPGWIPWRACAGLCCAASCGKMHRASGPAQHARATSSKCQHGSFNHSLPPPTPILDHCIPTSSALPRPLPPPSRVYNSIALRRVPRNSQKPTSKQSHRTIDCQHANASDTVVPPSGNAVHLACHACIPLDDAGAAGTGQRHPAGIIAVIHSR